MVLDGLPTTEAIEALRKHAVEGEAIELVGNVVYLHTPFGLGTSKLGEKFDKGIGVPNTARNWNTVLKLRELAKQAMGGRPVSETFADRWATKWAACGFEDVGIGMVACGDAVLPDSAAPSLSFDRAGTPVPLLVVIGLNWSADDRERLARYRVIGSDGAGNPICTADGTVVLLDHEDRFTTEQFVNGSVHCLAECLLAYLGEKDPERFREAVRAIDPPSLAERAFWWQAARGLEA